MAEFKLVIANPRDGRCVQRDLKAPEANSLLGTKLGSTVNGESIGLPGYEFMLTGGSDYCGCPMRRDVQGTGRKKIIAVSGVGLKAKEKGIRQRKTVCGNTVHDKIVQLNLKVVKEGGEKIFGEQKEGKEKAGKEEAEKEEAGKEKAEKEKAEKPKAVSGEESLEAEPAGA